MPLVQVTPKFCKQYGHVGDTINKALLEYKDEVENRVFPSSTHSPYKMNAGDVDKFICELQKLELRKAASSAEEAAKQFYGGWNQERKI